MAIALQVDKDRHLFVETFHGTVDVEAFEASLARKERLIANRSRWACLTDFRGCRIQLTSGEIRAVAAASARLHAGPAALTVDSDLNYALARQFKAYRESYTGLGSVGVFREVEAAHHWLHTVLTASAGQPREQRP